MRTAVDPALERGFIVLADLSGFTTFVTETEVRHGTEVVAALLDTVIRRLSPPLEVEEIEGDAVFAVGRERAPAAGPAIVQTDAAALRKVFEAAL